MTCPPPAGPGARSARAHWGPQAPRRAPCAAPRSRAGAAVYSGLLETSLLGLSTPPLGCLRATSCPPAPQRQRGQSGLRSLEGQCGRAECRTAVRAGGTPKRRSVALLRGLATRGRQGLLPGRSPVPRPQHPRPARGRCPPLHARRGGGMCGGGRWGGNNSCVRDGRSSVFVPPTPSSYRTGKDSKARAGGGPPRDTAPAGRSQDTAAACRSAGSCGKAPEGRGDGREAAARDGRLEAKMGRQADSAGPPVQRLPAPRPAPALRSTAELYPARTNNPQEL